jgi:MFS family permease
MTSTSPRKALQRRMWALFMFFFIPGLLMASWATRTPAIRDILTVSTAEMGIVLFGLSIGSMSGILCSAWLVKRFGTRTVIRTTMCCAVLGMVFLSVALWFASPLMFALGLTVFGGSFGAAEVAINVEGAAVEREMDKTVLPMMHGFYSLGTLAGAGVGMALTAFGVAANLHILLAALVCIIPILTGITAIPDGTGKNTAEEQKSVVKGLPFYRDMQLMLIGVVVLAMAFAEGSANDWLPLLMVDWIHPRHDRRALYRRLVYRSLQPCGRSPRQCINGCARHRVDYLCRRGLDSRRIGNFMGRRRIAWIPADYFRCQRHWPGCADTCQRGGDDGLFGLPGRSAAARFPR